MVQRQNERRVKASLKVGGSPLSPIPPEGAEEQLSDGEERKSWGASFYVAEIR